MNVYEFARECEKAAEKTYLNLAVKAGNKGMKAIFTMLAEMEKNISMPFSSWKNRWSPNCLISTL